MQRVLFLQAVEFKLGFIAPFTIITVGRGLGPAGYFAFSQNTTPLGVNMVYNEKSAHRGQIFHGGTKAPPYAALSAQLDKLKFEQPSLKGVLQRALCV